MMTIKVKRVVNPRRPKRVKARVRRRNPAKRKLSPKQIKHFGTPAQKAALRRSRAAKRGAAKRKRVSAPRRHASARKRNPIRRRRVAVKRASAPRRKARKSVRRRSNPALVVTLGALNPHKRSNKKMAKRRRKATRRRSNPTRIVVRRKSVRRRRRNPVAVSRTRRHSRRRVHSRRRRNPELFGRSVSASQMAQAVVGGLVGVTAAKMIPGMVPSSLTSSPIMRLLVTGAAAYGAGMLAKKVSPAFGDAVLFGGLMQAGSQLLNNFLPSVGSRIGLGELYPAQWSVPQNPIRAPQLGPSIVNAPSVKAAGGMGRAYGSAY